MNDELHKVVSGIGPKIKALRAENGLSLQALGSRADVSAATIHKMEQGDMVPTITTLLKIAAALQRPVAYFVEEPEHAPPTAVTRPAERPDIYTSHNGIHLGGITGPYDEFMVAAAFAQVQPHASSGAKPMSHGGEELVYVMSGSLEFTINGRLHVLKPGDSLHFRTYQPHSWRNPGDELATAIWMALRME
ncbi:MAG TPA: cupin domain-containing protein [Streptosporangiaceae bacterium]|jgi:transcriptional regulator with XRE-family HTH domain|nr:cupin domain-containing protein [Streptosporangiaceae bacterium]